MPATAPDLGWVRISSTDPPVGLLARLSDTRPNVDAGYGGWQEVARPRRRPLSVWTGSPGLRVSLPILFDDFIDGGSVERNIAYLERLATPTASDGQPPRVKFTAQGAHVPHQDRVWVIDSLTYGDSEMNASGNRTRQQVTIAFLEWIADVTIRERSPAKLQRAKVKRTKTKTGAANKRVIAAAGRTWHGSHGGSGDQRAVAAPAFGSGDDLLSIAARELGDASRWIEIAQLNGIRDPRSIMPGQVIRLP